jgi:hypothetical protein
MSELFPDSAAARLFEFVERGETEMPADYLPEAPGVMFAGEAMLSAAGYIPGSNRPRRWCRIGPGNYKKYVGKHTLMVRQCGGPRSEHWTIERLDEDYNTEALVFPFGHAPIFARSFQAAMRLAEYCYPIPRPPVAACWKVARLRR